QALARAGAAMAAGGPYRLEPGARERPRGQRATVDAEGLAIRHGPGGPARTGRAGKVVRRGTEGMARPVEGGGWPTETGGQPMKAGGEACRPLPRRVAE